MILGEFARLIDVKPKWVLNSMAGLHLPARYTVALARQLTVGRAIHEATGMPLERAVAMARRCLRAFRGEITPMAVSSTPDGDVALTVDLYRVLSAFMCALRLCTPCSLRAHADALPRETVTPFRRPTPGDWT